MYHLAPNAIAELSSKLMSIFTESDGRSSEIKLAAFKSLEKLATQDSETGKVSVDCVEKRRTQG